MISSTPSTVSTLTSTDDEADDDRSDDGVDDEDDDVGVGDDDDNDDVNGDDDDGGDGDDDDGGDGDDDDGGDGDDDDDNSSEYDCSLCEDLTDAQIEALAAYDNGGKEIVCDPTCLDGISDPIHCNCELTASS